MLQDEDQTTAIGDLHTKFHENRSSGSRDMLADRQPDRQTDRNTPLPYRGRATIRQTQYVFTEARSVSPVQQLDADESVFHQLDQTQHHLWYSTCHCVCNPNANNTAQLHTVFIYDSLYTVFYR